MGGVAHGAVRVRVAGLLVHKNEILLVEHRKEGRRYYLLPGGGVRFGETLAEALVREVEEECGLKITVGAPLFVSDTIAPDGSRHVVNVVFDAHIVGPGMPTKDPRVAGCRWIDLEVLGSVRLRPPLASAITDASIEGFRGQARYLGALWVDEDDDEGGELP